jgi:PPOX class probable F420-dependent enzyme
MPTQTVDPKLQDLLTKRLIATLATENEDGSLHLTAVWFLYQDGSFWVATSSRTRKARNVVARGKASLMIDVRKPGAERGITATGKVQLIPGEESRQTNQRIHGRYLSTAALGDPQVGKVFEAFDDVTIKLTPTSWVGWDMAALDAQVFGGKLAGTPGYMLPLE